MYSQTNVRSIMWVIFLSHGTIVTGILLLLPLLLLLTLIELSLGGSSPYSSTNKTNNNKYT